MAVAVVSETKAACDFHLRYSGLAALGLADSSIVI
jgi:hypothetical protein